MKEIKIQYSYPENEKNILHLEIKDSLNELLLESRFDFQQQGIKVNYTFDKDQAYSLTINDEEVDFVCHCQEDENDCHCEVIDKIRKHLYRVSGFKMDSCGCGGNCGCH